MSEKRFRPTLGQYRALESKVEELTEQVRLLEKANGYSTEEIEELLSYKSKYEAQHEEFRELHDKYDSLLEKAEESDKRNVCLEDEVVRLRKQAGDASRDYQRARREVLWLRGRNLWARIINVTDYQGEEG